MNTYKCNIWVKLDHTVEIQANSKEEAERELLEIYRQLPYADMDYVDGGFTLEAATEFSSVEPCYTGGGIYIFTGKLLNGNWFLADSPDFDVRILNADPDEPTYVDGDGVVWERTADDPNWQEAHLVEDLSEDEAIQFFRQMIEWVLANNPDGNYSMGDMEDILEEAKRW